LSGVLRVSLVSLGRVATSRGGVNGRLSKLIKPEGETGREKSAHSSARPPAPAFGLHSGDRDDLSSPPSPHPFALARLVLLCPPSPSCPTSKSFSRYRGTLWLLSPCRRTRSFNSDSSWHGAREYPRTRLALIGDRSRIRERERERTREGGGGGQGETEPPRYAWLGY